MALSNRLHKLAETRWLAEGLAAISGIIFFVQIWFYAHTQASILDEGAYLLKGYLFATGRYFPFQDYGPWTNHMPLSFLIPGYVQRIFGPGLRTGRYFAIFLGILMVLGVWLLARRLGGRWWALASVSVIALNVPLIKVYTAMASQGLVACMFVWVLVLTLGQDRRLWQLIAGTILAVLMVMTRLNMSPVLPFLILYIFWEHGKKVGWWNFAVGVVVFILGQAIFWPEILKLWVSWLPLGWIPYFQQWLRPEGALPNWTPGTQFNDRILSFWQAIRMHFFSIVGALAAWIMWPKKTEWVDAWRFRAAVFLSSLFAVLMAFHVWASLGKDYCIYCLSVYVGFFTILGILLVVITASSWRQVLPWGQKWLSPVLILGLSAGIGYGLIPVWGNKIVTSRFISRLMHIDVPRLKAFRIQPGTTELWSLFANKFGWSEVEVVEYAIDWSRAIVFVILGLMFGWLVLKFGNRIGKALVGSKISSGAAVLVTFLIFGTLFSLTAGLAPDTRDCGWDVIASYEAGGAHLAEYVPEGSKVYWWGGLTAVPLLYLQDVEIFPAQINHGYSYRRGGDPDELIRYGWWSAEVADQWLKEADVILIEARLYGGFATQFAESEDFDEVSPSPPMVPCRKNSPIHIYIRNE